MVHLRENGRSTYLRVDYSEGSHVSKWGPLARGGWMRRSHDLVRYCSAYIDRPGSVLIWSRNLSILTYPCCKFLGPLLFIYYINDIVAKTNPDNIILFADVVVIFLNGTNYKNLCKNCLALL